MKRAIVVLVVLASLLISPSLACAHHVGNAEDSMPADQWVYVDSVAHGVGADGNSQMDIAPGDEAGAETMSGENSWEVSGQAYMNTP